MEVKGTLKLLEATNAGTTISCHQDIYVTKHVGVTYRDLEEVVAQAHLHGNLAIRRLTCPAKFDFHTAEMNLYSFVAAVKGIAISYAVTRKHANYP